jgi:tripartite-type tricarboxylate transporter receptor subunit TctC
MNHILKGEISMKKKWLHVLLGILALVLIAGFFHQAQAASYPARDITMIITWPAGSNTDLAGRQFSEVMGKLLGKTIIIQNVGGGSGAIGMYQGAQARPDGYTLTYVSSGPTVIQPCVQKVPYDPIRDFVQIAQLFGEELAVVAKSDAPYNDLKEMVDYYKKTGTTPKFATSGTGSNNHLAMVLLNQTIGLPMIHVPFGSSAEAMNAVVGGNVPLANATPSTMIGHLQEGRIKVMAVLSEKRLNVFKNVPTAMEQGYNFTFGGWNGILAPKGTPKDFIDKLADAAKKALEHEALIKQSAMVARPIDFLSGPEFGERIKRELARNCKLVKAEGLGAK